jgi:tetratricopeptide (TPR) repeat protein
MLAWNYMSHTDAPWREIGSAAEDVREVLSITTVAFLCAGILFACAILSAGAQAPSRLAESPTTSLTRKLNRAIAMAERGDPQQAMVLADALLERHPDFVPALKLKGMLLEEMGRGAEASGVYERALKLAPNDPGLLFKLAVMRLAAGDNDQAIQLFLRHLRILPRDGDALFYLAQAYHLNGQDDLALKTVRESVKSSPDNAQAWQKYGEMTCASGDNEAGMRLLLKARQLDPALEKIDLDVGTAYFNAMDFSGAVKSLSRAASQRPGDRSVLVLLASAEVKLSQWQDARTVFERILAIDKNDEDSLLGLGDCELELKQYAEAIDTLRHVLQVNPAQLQAHYYLSRAYAGLGRTAEARHEVELHQRMEQMSFAQPELGSEGNNSTWNQARQYLAEGREEEALKLFQKASQDSSATSGDPYVFVGSLYLSMGDRENALRNLRRAWEIDPGVRGAHTYAGLAALQSSDLETAGKEFQAELANDRNYLPAIAELGEVRYRQQQWAEAADLLSNSRTSNPVNLYMLCDSLFHLGKTQDAELTAEVLASHARKEPETMRALIDLLDRNGESALARRLSGNANP